MIDKSHDLSVTRQAELLGISRSNVYYLPLAVPEVDLTQMRRMDELHINYPFAGARMLSAMLHPEGMVAPASVIDSLQLALSLAIL